jgi:hypothetical protein
MNFPEAEPERECDVYDHLKPYLWTKTLRFSFGSVKGRPREDWQPEVATLPLDQAVKELERYGFAGLYYNRKGYEDRAEQRLKELAKLGKAQLVEDEARDQVCVVLDPSPNPAWPHSDDAAQVAISDPSDCTAALFTVGNSRRQPGFWAGRSKVSWYFMNDRPQSCAFRMTAYVIVPTPRKMEIQFEGKPLWSRVFVSADAQPLDVRLVAQPGRNYLHFTSDRKPEPRPDQPQAIRVTGALVGLRIIKDPPSQP